MNAIQKLTAELEASNIKRAAELVELAAEKDRIGKDWPTMSRGYTFQPWILIAA